MKIARFKNTSATFKFGLIRKIWVYIDKETINKILKMFLISKEIKM